MTENSLTPRPDYWAELHDVISDAISDSIDQDWTPSTGATYVVEALKKEPMFAAAPEGHAVIAAFIEACDGACLVEHDHPQAAFADVLRAAYEYRSRARGGE